MQLIARRKLRRIQTHVQFVFALISRLSKNHFRSPPWNSLHHMILFWEKILFLLLLLLLLEPRIIHYGGSIPERVVPWVCAS